jgi:MFS family permease
MAYSSFGLLVVEVFTVLAAKFPQHFTVNIFLVGATVDGLCGSFMLAMALAYSYGADCTSPKHRAVAFGAFQGCLFFGIAVGPMLGGLLVEATGNMLSIFYAAMVSSDLYSQCCGKTTN